MTVAEGVLAQEPNNPPAVAVPDEGAAGKIAEKALVRIYGKKQVQSERPFTAELSNVHLARRRYSILQGQEWKPDHWHLCRRGGNG
jgi:hypothetical protein